jgi:hypothetical protein
MQLSNQAAGALLLALQKCLWEQTDIMPLLQEMVFEMSDDGLVVTNPPVVSKKNNAHLHLRMQKMRVNFKGNGWGR